MESEPGDPADTHRIAREGGRQCEGAGGNTPQRTCRVPSSCLPSVPETPSGDTVARIKLSIFLFSLLHLLLRDLSDTVTSLHVADKEAQVRPINRRRVAQGVDEALDDTTTAALPTLG